MPRARRARRRFRPKLDALLAGIPNLPAEDVPVGGEEANTEIRHWREKPNFAFQPKQHFELGEALGLMDFETAAKLSGSRFVVLKGALARMERALAAFMLDLHTGQFGYEEINPPLLVEMTRCSARGNCQNLKKICFEQTFAADTEDSMSASLIYRCDQ